jgi:FKBP-type peptidyl-prolyl cis-trans isomerase
MIQNKYVLGGVAAVVLLAIGGAGGFMMSRGDSQPKSATAAMTSAPQSSANTQTNQQSAGNLSVASNTQAMSLGQLGGSSSPQQGQNAGTGAAGSSASGTNAINPATFGEYEKYKDGTSALFGEMTVGTGTELTVNKKAAVYYKGWLTNGQMFDQSRPGADGKLQPFVFTLGAREVISGWEQGVVGMKVGGKRLIIVPPAVGYGAAGQGSIPGNAVLIFEVELLAVQ